MMHLGIGGDFACFGEAADLDDIFTEDPDGLWSSVLRRKGGEYELVARMPPDPSLN